MITLVGRLENLMRFETGRFLSQILANATAVSRRNLFAKKGLERSSQISMRFRNAGGTSKWRCAAEKGHETETEFET